MGVWSSALKAAVYSAAIMLGLSAIALFTDTAEQFGGLFSLLGFAAVALVVFAITAE